jgi:hypothetical protein
MKFLKICMNKCLVFLHFSSLHVPCSKYLERYAADMEEARAALMLVLTRIHRSESVLGMPKWYLTMVTKHQMYRRSNCTVILVVHDDRTCRAECVRNCVHVYWLR